MSKKKILALLPSTKFYGKERSNIEVYNLLNDQAEVKLHIVVNERASKDIFNYTNHLATQKMLFPTREMGHWRYAKYLYELVRANLSLILILLRFRPDYILLCSDITYYDFYIPLLISRVKIICRLGDSPAFPHLSNYKYNHWIWKNIACKKTDTFVCISQFIKAEIEKYGRRNNKDIIIYNFPPTRKIQDNRVEKQRYVQTDDIKIGYLGQIIKKKGVDLFVDAALLIIEKYNTCTFYIAGSLESDAKFSDELFQKLKNFRYREKIIFLEEVDDVELFFKNIDVLCVPSVKQEPLGNVLVEAKKYKTPCVIFNSGGMPELINHNRNGFICADYSAESIELGLKYYIDNPELIKIHGVNAFNSIEDLEIGYIYYKKKWLDVFEINNQDD